mmetsp:Transcript_92188/g.169175  ORF Transcript_92188/g.169175 Transcript_92188/m.169175 type:complete len:219 (+) Transcript_92188:1648-2304(+)
MHLSIWFRFLLCVLRPNLNPQMLTCWRQPRLTAMPKLQQSWSRDKEMQVQLVREQELSSCPFLSWAMRLQVKRLLRKPLRLQQMKMLPPRRRHLQSQKSKTAGMRWTRPFCDSCGPRWLMHQRLPTSNQRGACSSSWMLASWTQSASHVSEESVPIRRAHHHRNQTEAPGIHVFSARKLKMNKPVRTSWRRWKKIVAQRQLTWKSALLTGVLMVSRAT